MTPEAFKAMDADEGFQAFARQWNARVSELPEYRLMWSRLPEWNRESWRESAALQRRVVEERREALRVAAE